MNIRLLRPDEIEVRIGSISSKGATLLLYKDARCDMTLLDECFGPMGWQRSHECINGNLYCTISVYDKESKQWISKMDVGTAGYTEIEKSMASDSFKRAATCWGIGRELYSAGLIWVPAERLHLYQKGDKYVCNDHFKVSNISYDENREIKNLQICRSDGVVVFERHGIVKPTLEDNGLSGEQRRAFEAEIRRTGVPLQAVQDRYSLDDPYRMSQTTYSSVMAALRKTQSKVA